MFRFDLDLNRKTLETLMGGRSLGLHYHQEVVNNCAMEFYVQNSNIVSTITNKVFQNKRFSEEKW